MLNVRSEDVVPEPYPHVISDAFLPPELFSRLKADYPDERFFKSVAASTAGVGSRAGKNTGFDIYRGDEGYRNLMASSPAWTEFDGWINSPAFIAKYQELFGPYANDIGLCADIGASTYNRSYEEPRAVLTEAATIGEKFSTIAHKLTRNLRGRHGVDLFTRLDITRSLGGYAKPPHCDRGNRLCSLIIYFSDADETGLEGGDLLVFQANNPGPVEHAPRHPKADTVHVVKQIRPKPNRGVFFPCCNNSYHGVTAVTSQGIPRDFLYINISGQVSNLW